MKTDIVIGIVPIARKCPQTGPSLIKAYLKQKMYECKVVDWNIDLYNSIDREIWEKIEYRASEQDVKNVMDRYPELFKKWVDDVKTLNPEWLGLSVFARTFTYSFTEALCKLFKKEIPDIKILLGGHATNHLPIFYKNLLDIGLIDKIAIGDGEYATEKVLHGCGEKIIACDDVIHLKEMPFADYSDLNMELYPGDKPMLVVGSRGCINNCKFCQRYSNFYKSIKGKLLKKEISTNSFRSRGGNLIAKEVLNHYQNYGKTSFYISDACSNGDIKEFKLFIQRILKYNKSGILPKISWRTQLCCRSRKIMDEKVWAMMKKSGFHHLSFGLETGSERLRFDMGKRVSDSDIIFMFKQCMKNKINITVSMISGYCTETEEDFLKTLDFLKKWACDTPVIEEIYFGGLMNLEEGSFLYEKKHELGITIDKFGNWVYKNNNFPFRYKRWLRLKKFMEENNIKYVQRHTKLLADTMKKYK